ncbi:hypothetical protein ACIRO1_11780 [Streptomyces sp. NPDC102381]|uniref:hypothetical protein n=1 Tax=Streptomyces sp. NPDC102381 TaxID=3366164 RepID=UPI00380BF9AC
MPKPTPMNRRTLIAAWAVLCVGGLAATSALNGSSASDSTSGKPARTDCDERIADIEKWMAKREREEEKSGVISLSSIQVGTEDGCRDAIVDHFDDKR